MAVLCKAKQAEYLTRKGRGWVNPECAQSLSSEPALRACSKAGSWWLHIKMFPSVLGWALKQVTQKDSGISMLADIEIWIGKGSEHLALAVQGAQLQQEITLETSRHPFHLILHPLWGGVCSSGRAGTFEALFTGQPLSWGHCNPKIQFSLCSHQSRELFAPPNWWPLSPKCRQHGCP